MCAKKVDENRAPLEYRDLQWRKSRFCTAGDCVEFAHIDGQTVAIRDSKSPAQSPLVYSITEWRTFINAVKNGDFDA